MKKENIADKFKKLSISGEMNSLLADLKESINKNVVKPALGTSKSLEKNFIIALHSLEEAMSEIEQEILISISE